MLKIVLALVALSGVAIAEEDNYSMRPRVVNENEVWPMPQFVSDLPKMTIGVPFAGTQAACLKADDSERVAKLHVNEGYGIASQQFGRLREEDKCDVVTGGFFPHRVTWHGDLKNSTLKVVEVSVVKADGTVDFTAKLYIITEKIVVGSGLKDKLELAGATDI